MHHHYNLSYIIGFPGSNNPDPKDFFRYLKNMLKKIDNYLSSKQDPLGNGYFRYLSLMPSLSILYFRQNRFWCRLGQFYMVSASSYVGSTLYYKQKNTPDKKQLVMYAGFIVTKTTIVYPLIAVLCMRQISRPWSRPVAILIPFILESTTFITKQK